MNVIAGRYELRRPLGSGGVARVVEAYDTVLDRTVAMKLLRDDIATDPIVRERFVREARTAARFNHPNAVVVFDTGTDGDVPWIAMELVDGENLAERLAREGPLSEAEALRIADAVLSALSHAHSEGLVHRDVKPDNIMLLADGGVKLADFGIAKSLDAAAGRLTASGQITGTPAYLSPEQVSGDTATPASDVYAMGIVLYEMLVGSPPYTGEDPIAIAVAHTRRPVPDLAMDAPSVAPALAAVVSTALAKDPADRFADAAAMRRALPGGGAGGDTAVLTAGTTQMLPAEGTAVRTASASLTSLWWWGVGSAAALTVIALVALVLGGQSPSDAPPPSEPAATEATQPPQEEEEEEEAAPQERQGDDDGTKTKGKASGKGKAKGRGKGKDG